MNVSDHHRSRGDGIGSQSLRAVPLCASTSHLRRQTWKRWNEWAGREGDLRANSSRGAFHSPQTPPMRGLQWKVGTASLVRAWFFLDLYEENWPQNVKHNYTVTETETSQGLSLNGLGFTWCVLTSWECLSLLSHCCSCYTFSPWAQWLTITFSNRLAYGRNNEHIRFWCTTQTMFFLPVTQALNFYF